MSLQIGVLFRSIVTKEDKNDRYDAFEECVFDNVTQFEHKVILSQLVKNEII